MGVALGPGQGPIDPWLLLKPCACALSLSSARPPWVQGRGVTLDTGFLKAGGETQESWLPPQLLLGSLHHNPRNQTLTQAVTWGLLLGSVVMFGVQAGETPPGGM